MWLLSMSLGFALAGQPAWCVASWQAPEPGCAIEGRIVSSAAGPSLEAAEAAARKRLGRVANLAADDLVGNQFAAPAQVGYCEALARENAEVSCSDVQSASDGDYCFVTFEDADCWDGTVLTVERGGWQAVVRGRQRMCAAVDAREVRQNYGNVDERRTRCAERCATGVVVSCPPER